MGSRTESSSLFVADLPDDLTEPDFVSLWEDCDGYIRARLRQDRNENVVGFVDFSDSHSAVLARERFNGYKFSAMSDEGISVQFAHGKTRLKRTRDTEDGGYNYHRQDNYGGRGDSRMGGHQHGHALSNFPMMVPAMVGPAALPMSSAIGMHAGELPFYSHIPNASFASYGGMGYQTLPAEAVSTLYVEGLPSDATEREMSHIFRQMPGFMSLRILPKESKQYPNRTYNLCFVEFESKYQATIAMNALQGYKMDKNDSKGLSLSYAKTARKDRRKLPSNENGSGTPNTSQGSAGRGDKPSQSQQSQQS